MDQLDISSNIPDLISDNIKCKMIQRHTVHQIASTKPIL